MNSNPIRTFVFMGRTGCGKGTQSHLLSEKLGYKIFSTGSRFREIKSQENYLGRRLRSDYDQGYLMPSWFASFVFEEALLHLEEDEGLIFEGVGRTEREAVTFDEVCEWLRRPYQVFYIEVSEEESLRRQVERSKVDPTRTESNTEDKIRLRFREYDRHTVPAIDFFRERGKVINISGEQTPEKIHEDIMHCIERL